MKVNKKYMEEVDGLVKRYKREKVGSFSPLRMSNQDYDGVIKNFWLKAFLVVAVLFVCYIIFSIYMTISNWYFIEQYKICTLVGKAGLSNITYSITPLVASTPFHPSSVQINNYVSNGALSNFTGIKSFLSLFSGYNAIV
jgi:hypothetical protein